MKDITELPRLIEIAKITSEIESNDEEKERARLVEKYGADNVWDTEEVSRNFEIIGFMAPFVVAIRQADKVKGSLQFQHSPRFYFNWREA
jgi:hypothetical protein